MDGRGHGRRVDTGFDVPPSFGEADERRMHARAHQYWSQLLNGRAFPSVADLHPASLDDFGPTSILLDFSGGPDAPRLRFIGKQLRQECGLNGFDLYVDDVPARSLISRLTDHFHEILANRAPIGFEAEFVSSRGTQTLYRGILMPLSSNGCSIDYVFGVINWKEVAGIDLTATIAQELATLDLSGSGGAGIGRRLAAARTAAGQFEKAEGRSLEALHQALAFAYELYLARQAEPDGFSWILAESRLKGQVHTLMSDVIKLVFGAGHDKAKQTKFAAALSVAARAGVPSGGFAAFINAAGGLQTLVAADRLARLVRKSRTGNDRKMETRSRLRLAPGVAKVAIPDDGSEFVLLIARREANDMVSVIQTVPNARNLLDLALDRLGSAPCPGLSQAA